MAAQVATEKRSINFKSKIMFDIDAPPASALLKIQNHEM